MLYLAIAAKVVREAALAVLQLVGNPRGWVPLPALEQIENQPGADCLCLAAHVAPETVLACIARRVMVIELDASCVLRELLQPPNYRTVITERHLVHQVARNRLHDWKNNIGQPDEHGKAGAVVFQVLVRDLLIPLAEFGYLRKESISTAEHLAAQWRPNDKVPRMVRRFVEQLWHDMVIWKGFTPEAHDV